MAAPSQTPYEPPPPPTCDLNLQLGDTNFTIRAFINREDWQRFVASNPGLPQNQAQILSLASRFAPTERHIEKEKQGPFSNFDECGERIFNLFLAGLRNPGVSFPTVQERLRGAFDTDLESQYSTGRILVKWKGGIPLPPTNWDQQLVAHLEDLWNQYNAAFGRPPHTPAGSGRLLVVVRPLGRVRGFTSPDGPLVLNSDLFLATTPEKIRKAVCAHELFHREQYAFGLRAHGVLPTVPYHWFTEGTASWAEIHFTDGMSSEAKGTALFDWPELGLRNASYYAMPFWTAIIENAPDPLTAMRGLLENFEASSQNIEAALAATGAALPDHFDRFSRRRMNGTWIPATMPLPTRDTVVAGNVEVIPIAENAATTRLLRSLASHCYLLPAPRPPALTVNNAVAGTAHQYFDAEGVLDVRNHDNGVAYRIQFNGSNVTIDPAPIPDGDRGVPLAVTGACEHFVDRLGNVITKRRDAGTGDANFTATGFAITCEVPGETQACRHTLTSIGCDDPSRPNILSDDFVQAAFAQNNDSITVTLMPAPIFAQCAIARVVRHIGIRSDQSLATFVELNTEIFLDRGAHRRLDYTARYKTAAILSTTVDADDESPARCPPSSDDCDGATGHSGAEQMFVEGMGFVTAKQPFAAQDGFSFHPIATSLPQSTEPIRIRERYRTCHD